MDADDNPSDWDDIELKDRRADALRNGELVAAGALDFKGGVRVPVALTRAVWQTCVAAPPGASREDRRGRLRLVLSNLAEAIQDTPMPDGSVWEYVVMVHDAQQGPKPVMLHAVPHDGAVMQTVITILLAEEECFF